MVDEAPAQETKLQQAARKYAEGQYLRLLKEVRDEIQKQSFDASSIAAIFDALEKETDRGLAVLAAAYLDEAVKEIYLKHLNPGVEQGLESLFSPNGPLGGAASRIHLAFALNWIRDKTYRNVRFIQKIRNRFAHSPSIDSFDRPAILSLLNNMDACELDFHNEVVKAGHPLSELTARQRFHIRAVHFTTSVVLEMSSAPRAIRRGLAPHAVLTLEYDDWAELHKNVLAQGYNACLRVITQASAAGRDNNSGP